MLAAIAGMTPALHARKKWGTAQASGGGALSFQRRNPTVMLPIGATAQTERSKCGDDDARDWNEHAGEQFGV